MCKLKALAQSNLSAGEIQEKLGGTSCKRNKNNRLTRLPAYLRKYDLARFDIYAPARLYPIGSFNAITILQNTGCFDFEDIFIVLIY